jgi:hypothetical protein
MLFEGDVRREGRAREKKGEGGRETEGGEEARGHTCDAINSGSTCLP